MDSEVGALRAALDARFADGTRRAVVVFGAGLHAHLRAHDDGGTPGTRWDQFTRWNDLLASIANDFDIAVQLHADPTATWESLVTRVAFATGLQASRSEDEALHWLAGRLEPPPGSPQLLTRFGRALCHAAFRDIVCLNFDRTVEAALGGAMTAAGLGGKYRWKASAHVPCRHAAGLTRVWYPHGHVADPPSIQLGQHAYGMSISQLEAARKRHKQSEQAWRMGAVARPRTAEARVAWEAARRVDEFGAKGQHRDGDRRSLSWLDALLVSDLVILGCSLDRAETDLWWTLHERARNHARAPEAARPRTFFLGPQSTLDQARHLATGVAGIVTVPFASWDDAWAALIGRWWEPTCGRQG